MKRELENFGRLCLALNKFGLTVLDVSRLVAFERAVSRQAIRECNGEVKHDVASRGSKARFRVEALLKEHGLALYRPGDCRGCMLYAIRPGDIPEGQDVGAYYMNGIALCI
jgi:hypothetical protein